MPIFIPRKPEIWQRKLTSPVSLSENHWASDRLTAAFPLTEKGGEFVDLVDGVVLGAQNGAKLVENSSEDVVAETYINGTKFFKIDYYKPYEPANYVTFILGFTRTNTNDSFGKILNYGNGLADPWGSYVIEQAAGSGDSAFRAYIAVGGTRYITPTFSNEALLGENLQLTYRYDGGTLSLFKNGVVLGSVAVSGTMSGSYGAEGLSLGARHDGGQRYAAHYDYLWMFHDGVLDNDEIASLYEAPYQFLVSKKTYSFLPTASTPGVSLTAQQGTITLTGILPSIALGISILAGQGAINVTGELPSLAISSDLTAQQGTISTTGEVPSETLGYSQAAQEGSLNIVGEIPLLTSGYNTLAQQGTINLVGELPSATLGLNGISLQGLINVTGEIPLAILGNSLVALQGTLNVAGETPSTTIGISLTSTSGAISITGEVPSGSFGGSLNLSAGLGTINVTGDFPTLINGITLTSIEGIISISGESPVVSLGYTAISQQGSITLAGETPTIDVSSSVNLISLEGTISVVGETPIVTVGYSSIGLQGNIAILGEVPSFLGDLPYNSIALQGNVSILGEIPSFTTKIPTFPCEKQAILQSDYVSILTSDYKLTINL